MTTYSAAFTADNTTDATFRTWGTAFAATLAGCGLIKTADSGQINWTTVNRTATPGTMVGYEVYRFNDSLQATAPIFLKFYYGTGNQAQQGNGASGLYSCGWQVEVGTGTNGSGTITGQLIYTSSGSYFSLTYPAQQGYDGSQALPVYACHTEGSFFITTPVPSAPPGAAFAAVRTRDNTDTVTADGIQFYGTPSAGYSFQCVTTDFTGTHRITTNQGNLGNNGWVAFNIWNAGGEATAVAGSPATFQPYVHYWMPKHTVMRLPVFSITTADTVGIGSTFQATPIGTTSHTFISIGQALSYYEINAFLWE